MTEDLKHYHIHYPVQHRFNPDVRSIVGFAKGHVVNDEDPQTSYSGNFNPDIDYVDTTPPPTVIVPSFGEWFGTIADVATIRSALNSGGATGKDGLNHRYFKTYNAEPTHKASPQNLTATSVTTPLEPTNGDKASSESLPSIW